MRWLPTVKEKYCCGIFCERKSADVFVVQSLLSRLLILMICGQDVCLWVCGSPDRLRRAVTTR